MLALVWNDGESEIPHRSCNCSKVSNGISTFKWYYAALLSIFKRNILTPFISISCAVANAITVGISPEKDEINKVALEHNLGETTCISLVSSWLICIYFQYLWRTFCIPYFREYRFIRGLHPSKAKNSVELSCEPNSCISRNASWQTESKRYEMNIFLTAI